jgi:zinc transport system substrate-binding protein
MRFAIALFALVLGGGPLLAAPRVIASVVPVYGIVAAVMSETGQPELLLSGSMSEHRAAFTTAQVASLGKADLVFIVGHGLEAKLAQMSGSEAVNGKAFVALSDAPGVTKLPIREGGAWESEVHADEHENHDDMAEGVLGFDPHVWLDPGNAKAMALQVAAELGKADPANAATYKTNAEAFAASVDETATAIAAELQPVRDRPYVVFHDAYHYFEKRFGLAAVGSISDVSARAPSARRLKEIRDKLVATHAVCVFREPQYDDRVVNTVLEGTAARAGILDPLGASLTPGPEVYQQLLRNLAASLKACLAG